MIFKYFEKSVILIVWLHFIQQTDGPNQLDENIFFISRSKLFKNISSEDIWKIERPF